MIKVQAAPLCAKHAHRGARRGWVVSADPQPPGKGIGNHFTGGSVGVGDRLNESEKTRHHQGFEPQTL